MAKIVEIGGEKYSLKSFEEYKRRAKFEAKVDNGVYSLDIYTTETDSDKIFNSILLKKTEAVYSLKVIHIATKEQDDLDTKFILDWLK